MCPAKESIQEFVDKQLRVGRVFEVDQRTKVAKFKFDCFSYCEYILNWIKIWIGQLGKNSNEPKIMLREEIQLADTYIHTI